MVTLALQQSGRFTLRQLLRWPGELYLGEHGARNRQLTGTLASIAIHSLLLWALLVRFNVIGPNNQTDHYGAMQLLQLQTRDADPGADTGSTAAPAPASELSDETSVQETALDTVVDTSVTPIWAVPTAAPTEPVAAPAQHGGIGSSSYDPYAGSVPMRSLDTSTATLRRVEAASEVSAPVEASPSTTNFFTLDRRAFDQFRRDLIATLPHHSASFRLRVYVSSLGIIYHAELIEGETNDATLAAIRLINGRQLFVISDPLASQGIFELPAININKSWIRRL